jgi:hypothetical protein
LLHQVDRLRPTHQLAELVDSAIHLALQQAQLSHELVHLPKPGRQVRLIHAIGFPLEVH